MYANTPTDLHIIKILSKVNGIVRTYHTFLTTRDYRLTKLGIELGGKGS